MLTALTLAQLILQQRANMFKISIPTKSQAVHGVERVLLVFVTVSVGYWLKSPQPFSKATSIGAALAGATAVYQAVLSTITTL